MNIGSSVPTSAHTNMPKAKESNSTKAKICHDGLNTSIGDMFK